MKTIAEIQSLIEYNAKEAVKKDEKTGKPLYKKSKVKSFLNKIALLKQCKRYLETNPREEYVKQMQAEAYKHINTIDSGFAAWIDDPYNKSKINNNDKPLGVYRKIMERNKFVAQAKTLDFLLK